MHMYRPLAGQLRILFCDSPALLTRVFPDLAIQALRRVEWLEQGNEQLGVGAGLRVDGVNGSGKLENSEFSAPFGWLCPIGVSAIACAAGCVQRDVARGFYRVHQLDSEIHAGGRGATGTGSTGETSAGCQFRRSMSGKLRRPSAL
jgi:hypothetical protein